jgi:amidase
VCQEVAFSYACAIRQSIGSEDELNRGQHRGPLHGVPIAVKDLCYTDASAGMACWNCRDRSITSARAKGRRLHHPGELCTGEISRAAMRRLTSSRLR